MNLTTIDPISAKDGDTCNIEIYLSDKNGCTHIDSFSWVDTFTGENSHKVYEFEVRNDWIFAIPHGPDNPIYKYNYNTLENDTIYPPYNSFPIIYDNSSLVFLRSYYISASTPYYLYRFIDESGQIIKEITLDCTLNTSKTNLNHTSGFISNPYTSTIIFENEEGLSEIVFFDMDTCLTRRYYCNPHENISLGHQFYVEYNDTLYLVADTYIPTSIYRLVNQEWKLLHTFPIEYYQYFSQDEFIYLSYRHDGDDNESHKIHLDFISFNLNSLILEDTRSLKLNFSMTDIYEYSKYWDYSEFQLYFTYRISPFEIITKEEETLIGYYNHIVQIKNNQISAVTLSWPERDDLIPLESDPIDYETQVYMMAILPGLNKKVVGIPFIHSGLPLMILSIVYIVIKYYRKTKN